MVDEGRGKHKERLAQPLHSLAGQWKETGHSCFAHPHGKGEASTAIGNFGSWHGF